jgi:hypothetical protein
MTAVARAVLNGPTMRSTLILASSLLSPTLVACVDAGERAEYGCPPGEVCSPTTPEGLLFAGPTFADGWADRSVKRTAVGGVQVIELYDNRNDSELRVPYNASFDADALEVIDTTRNLVETRGMVAGQARLRITDSYGLLDRIMVSATAIATAELVPVPWSSGRAADEGPWVAWAGADGRFFIALRDDIGERLVDEAMTIASPGAIPTRWDAFDLVVPAAGIDVTVTAGARQAPIALAAPATSSVTAVRTEPDDDQPRRAGTSEYVCFDAFDGGAQIVFAPWTFQVGGPARIDGGAPGGCARVHFDAVGTVVVTGAVAGVSATATFEVAAAASKRAIDDAGGDAAADRDATPTPSRGERAGSL